MNDRMRFGVATADHQCEAYDGRDDVRDAWERVRGLTPRGRATDFWNRYREDVDLAKGMGCRAFRLSLSWARLEPQAGAWDEDAFAHYRSVLQCMRDAGMATIVTLHHNTWPLHVQAAGEGAGMLDAQFPARMGAYASAVAQRLGDLIDYYVTINEPNQLVYGYVKGFWMRAYPVPPGLSPFTTSEEQMDAVLRLIPNLFRAHACARDAIRKSHPDAMVGANPLILGLPRWLQRLADRNATHVRSPERARNQAKRISQHHVLETGGVDVSIAQITLTDARMQGVLFSEPYALARFALLHADSCIVPETLETWKARIAVLARTPAASRAAGFFADARVAYFTDASAAVQAVRRGEADALFDDDLILQQYVQNGLTLSRVSGPDQPFAAAMALGNRALLNAVDRAIREYKAGNPAAPQTENRKTVAYVGREHLAEQQQQKRRVPDLDKSLQAIRKRGFLRVGVRPGVPGLCMKDASGTYTGLEPDLARLIAKRILGRDDAKVQFHSLQGERRLHATRSWLGVFDGLRKTIAIFGTLLGTNWWNLGMAGKLPEFLCPPQCAGALDFVGLDYYWGVPSFWPGQLQRLAAASEFRYGSAPVWPAALDEILRDAQKRFPGKPIVVIENGCVTSADGFSRSAYVEAHVRQVQRALRKGVPVAAYVCWSITSNREWGLPFDENSDFGLYHIDLDTDPDLKRVPTESSRRYAQIIASHDESPAGTE